MIISNSRQFIFIHVTKAAGTSITAALVPTIQWNDLVLGGFPFGERIQPHYQERYGVYKHSTARQVLEMVGSDLWEQYFTFSFVRHPYHRAYSLYTFVAQRVLAYGWRRRLPGALRRENFWRWPATLAYLDAPRFADFIRHPLFLDDDASKPQVDWLSDENGALIVDFVGKVEQLETDFAQVAQRIGLMAYKLPVKNPSGSGVRSSTAKLGPEDYAYLAQRFRADFEMFGYDPELEL